MADRQPTGEYADRYLDLAEALEKLFKRPVDLVTEQSIHNPYFQQEIETTRQLVYEQASADSRPPSYSGVPKPHHSWIRHG
jgi:hypothetical protein